MPSFQPPDSAATARFLSFLGLDTRQPFGQQAAAAPLTPATLEASGAAAEAAPASRQLPDLSGIIKAIATTPAPVATAPAPSPSTGGEPPIVWTGPDGRTPYNPVPIGYGNRF